MESPSYGDLPTEIIMEILLRWPVKTLLRLKCVCKKWYTLVGSPTFINQHFGHESNQEKLLIWHWNSHHAFHYKFRFAFYVDEMYYVYEEADPLQGLGEAEILMGPLNGVFCVVNREKPRTKMALLNPAMRQFKSLPLLHRNVEPHLLFHISSLGFGLDQVSGDCKVVSIQYLWNKNTRVLHRPPLVYVYNSGSNSWRQLEDVDLVYSMHSVRRFHPFGTYLDGGYYWLMDLEDDYDAIIGFDMRSEKFREIRVPDYITSRDRYLILALNGDSLALLSFGHSDQTGTCVNVWVMENERCWVKLLTLSSLGDVRPFGFWKKNDLILGGLTSIFALDNSEEKLWAVETPVRSNSSMFFCAYKESLVSIKREGDNCKLWDTCSDFMKGFFRQS